MKKLLFLVILLLAIWLTACFLAPERSEVQIEETLKFPQEVVQKQFQNLGKFSKFAPMISDSSKFMVSLYPMQEGKNARLSYQTSKEEEGVRNLIILFDETDSIGYEMSDREGEYVVDQTVYFKKVSNEEMKISWKAMGMPKSFPLRFINLFGFGKWKKELKKSIQKLKKHLAESEKELLMSIELEKAQKPVETEFLGGKYLTLFNETSCDSEEYKTAIKESFGRLYSYLKDYKKQEPKGDYTIFWEYYDINNDKAKFYCAIPIEDAVPVSAEEDFELKFFHNKPAFAFQVHQPFDSLHLSYRQMTPFLKNKLDYIPSRGIEVYRQIPTKNKMDSVKLYIPLER